MGTRVLIDTDTKSRDTNAAMGRAYNRNRSSPSAELPRRSIIWERSIRYCHDDGVR